jgi:transposase
MAMAEMSPNVKEGWHAVRCVDLDDMRRQNILFWQQAGGVAIRQAAWELVEEWWQMKKKNPDELRFQRLASQLREP